MTTTNIHLEPARRIRPAFIIPRRRGVSRDRQQSVFLQKEVAAYAPPTIEKNGTGIEKNGTGIVWEALA